LRECVYVWETATSDPEPIQAVKGYGSTIEGEPLQYHPPAPASGRVANSTELFEALRATVQNKHEFRMILDLKECNHDQVEQVKVKMETLKTVTKLITPGCWFYSLDLKDAYYSMPVHEDMRKYLRFMFEGVLDQYTVMPNGHLPRAAADRILSYEIRKAIKRLLSSR
jgi:hypothetical protein